jgi:hypothetical protein
MHMVLLNRELFVNSESMPQLPIYYHQLPREMRRSSDMPNAVILDRGEFKQYSNYHSYLGLRDLGKISSTNRSRQDYPSVPGIFSILAVK